jgi:CRP-like cAMP-binding protein
MPGISQSSVRNRLLQKLPASAFEEILPHMQAIDLPVRMTLVDADVPTAHIVFVESGLASVVAESSDAETVEVGHVGYEGMTGAHIVLMTDRTPNRTFMMCDDRIEGRNLSLTHEFLSIMLGVRRSGVTNELHILEGMHTIKATRGNVEITDRQKLEEVAGGSYGLSEREYDRLLGPKTDAGQSFRG